MYRANVNGVSRLVTKDEAQQLSAKHPMAIQIGIPAEDVTIAGVPAPQYRVAGTGEVISEAEIAARSDKRDVVKIGVQLPASVSEGTHRQATALGTATRSPWRSQRIGQRLKNSFFRCFATASAIDCRFFSPAALVYGIRPLDDAALDELNGGVSLVLIAGTRREEGSSPASSQRQPSAFPLVPLLTPTSLPRRGRAGREGGGNGGGRARIATRTVELNRVLTKSPR